jgi:Family of unknown function (DUF6364)
MQTKLTLRLEDELIEKAKVLARKRGKSLSKLVSEYFSFITSKDIKSEDALPPIVKSLYGSLANLDINENDYKKHLEGKYL